MYTPDGARLSTATLDAEAAEAVLSELDAADGIKNTPLFKSKPRAATTKKASPSASLDMDDEVDVDSALEEGEEEDADAAAQQFWAKGGHSRKIDSKFVQLADILPPVPAKGDFDLQKIRESLYFFS